MENPNIVLPELDEQLDWNVLVGSAEKPLRYLDAVDLRSLASAPGRLAGAYARLAFVLPAGGAVEDIDPATFINAFWGDEAPECRV